MVRSNEEDMVNAVRGTIDNLKKEKQQIIGIVSHDLKAPFTRIHALAQLLTMENRNLTADQQNYLDKIQQVVADGLSMVRNLVDYRNIEYRGIELNPEEINIKTFLLDMVKSFESLADKKNITLTLFAENDITIVSDNQCLSRVIDNLLSNAIKFSREGKEVKVQLVNKPGHVEIQVTDQARGFTPDDLKKLFHKFQKLSARPTAGESSTGLGLFVAYQFLEKIGGTLQCQSEEGVGSTFIVSLPK